MKLVIVESPAKAKTIKRYLGEGFDVAATMGHVKDLPKSDLGVDIEHDFEPDYQVITGKRKTVSELRKKLPRNESDVYLALDPDREGEAIAAHVSEVLKLKHPKRVVFHEITQNAVKDAISHPREVNMDLVGAQKARRVLDRLVGYKLSGLLWKKIWYGLSAGRVQSVATRLVVEREREREAFIPKEFWDLFAHLLTEKKKELVCKLAKKDGKKFVPSSKEEAKEVETDLDGAEWKLGTVESVDKRKYPSPPFTTSTLQQSASSYLGYNPSRTMQLAQQLYQGVNIKGKGNQGLVTYMRTDSTVLSNEAVEKMRDIIKENYGKNYIPDKPVFYKTKSRLAQEAHEAIRPTDFTLSPEMVKSSLTDQQYRLYLLIWNRSLACQMTPMVYYERVAEIRALCRNAKVYDFMLKGNQIVFDGFAKVMGSYMVNEESLQEIESLHPGERFTCENIETIQNFTKPRPRFTEATLIKALERRGIGRPSTYATIVSTIQSRGYVGRDGRYLFPTDVGRVVNDFLVNHFSDIVDYQFTSNVEESLDDVAQGTKKWVPVVRGVYDPFAKTLEDKDKSVKKEDVVILGDSDIPCPECKGKMVQRLGREGVFLSCARFPKCKGMLGVDGKSLEELVDLKKYRPAEPCPECKSTMVAKRGKYGFFWACSTYPDCKGTSPMLLRETCPECGSPLVERKGKWGKSFTGCSGYPKCTYIKRVPRVKSKTKKS